MVPREMQEQAMIGFPGFQEFSFVLINASNMHLSQHPQFDMQERVVHAGRTWGDVGIKGH